MFFFFYHLADASNSKSLISLTKCDRYMTEVRRLALPQNHTEAVYRGFRELEESLLTPFSLNQF